MNMKAFVDNSIYKLVKISEVVLSNFVTFQWSVLTVNWKIISFTNGYLTMNETKNLKTRYEKLSKLHLYSYCFRFLHGLLPYKSQGATSDFDEATDTTIVVPRFLSSTRASLFCFIYCSPSKRIAASWVVCLDTHARWLFYSLKRRTHQGLNQFIKS